MEKNTENRENLEPRVRLFGEEVGRKSGTIRNRCSRQEYGIVWGVILLVLGIVLLLNNFGVVAWDFWKYVWPFWPMFLIVAGIQVMLGQNLISEIISAMLVLLLLSIIFSFGLVQIESDLVRYLPAEFVELVKMIKFNNNF